MNAAAVSPHISDTGVIATTIIAVCGAIAAIYRTIIVPARDISHKIDKVLHVVEQLQPNGGESMFDRVERLDASRKAVAQSIDLLNDRVAALDARLERRAQKAEEIHDRLRSIETTLDGHVEWHRKEPE